MYRQLLGPRRSVAYPSPFLFFYFRLQVAQAEYLVMLVVVQVHSQVLNLLVYQVTYLQENQVVSQVLSPLHYHQDNLALSLHRYHLDLIISILLYGNTSKRPLKNEDPALSHCDSFKFPSLRGSKSSDGSQEEGREGRKKEEEDGSSEDI
jgi:hypothetical protein